GGNEVYDLAEKRPVFGFDAHDPVHQPGQVEAAHAGQLVAGLDVGGDAGRLQCQKRVDVEVEVVEHAWRIEEFLVRNGRPQPFQRGDVGPLVAEPRLEVGELLRRQAPERFRHQALGVKGRLDLFRGEQRVEDLLDAVDGPRNADDLAFAEHIRIGDLRVGREDLLYAHSESARQPEEGIPGPNLVKPSAAHGGRRGDQAPPVFRRPAGPVVRTAAAVGTGG